MRIWSATAVLALVIWAAGAQIPRLEPGRNAGAVYSPDDATNSAVLDLAFNETLTAGAGVYVVDFGWRDLEPTPGVIDTAIIDGLLALIESLGLRAYVNISVVDTVAITVPTDLADPMNGTELAPGLSWDDQTIVDRLGAVIDAVTPIMNTRNGYFLGLGNEIDPYFIARPGALPAYMSLVDQMRARAKAIDPMLAVGVNVTSDATQIPGFTAAVWPSCDAASYTYYPLDGSFGVRPPTDAAADLDAMLAGAGTLPVILREVGYPSGQATGGLIGSSEALQAAFVREVDAATRERPRVRAVHWFLLNDWSPLTVNAFTAFFGINDPAFEEYLGSLGLYTAGGVRKQGYPDLLGLLSWCPADLDGNGQADFFDVLEMLRRVDAAGNAGDFDANGVTSHGDVMAFLMLFDQGCP